jgi:hypothetical protein
MWLSFWVTVGFTMLFMLVEIVFGDPLPDAAGYVGAAVVSIGTNGWERFWEPEYYRHTVCTNDGMRLCFETTDFTRAPRPAGLVEVLWPWAGEQTFWEWLTRGVPLDLAGAALATGLLWVVFRAFGRQRLVEDVARD